MDAGSAINLALANWTFFAAVVVVRMMTCHEGIRSFRMRLSVEGLILWAEGAAAAIGSWLLRGLFLVLTGHGSVALHAPGRGFWSALGWTAVGYLPVAVFEEGLFRGYVQDRLAAKYGIGLAIAAQAALFGPMHILAWPAATNMLIRLAMVTVLALAMGTSARDGRSLLWAVGFHQWWNVVDTLIMQSISPVQLITAEAESVYGALVNLGAAIIVLGCVRLRFLGSSAPARSTATEQEAATELLPAEE